MRQGWDVCAQNQGGHSNRATAGSAVNRTCQPDAAYDSRDPATLTIVRNTPVNFLIKHVRAKPLGPSKGQSRQQWEVGDVVIGTQ